MQIISDDFHRADGALSAPYGAVTGLGIAANFAISSNTLIANPLTSDCAYANTSVILPADQYAETTVGTPTTSLAGHGYGCCVRMDTGFNGTFYIAVFSAAGYRLFKYVAYVVTVIVSAGTTTFANGDRGRLQAQGTTLSLFKNWATPSSSAFYTNTDTSITGVGYAGPGYSSTDTAGGSILLFTAGDLNVAPPRRQRRIFMSTYYTR